MTHTPTSTAKTHVCAQPQKLWRNVPKPWRSRESRDSRTGRCPGGPRPCQQPQKPDSLCDIGNYAGGS